MKIEVIALCDAATDSQGKLNILGAFDCIWANQLPAAHPQCAIALRVRFSRIEEGNHKIKINVVDFDGNMVVPGFDGNVAIRIKPGDEYAVANLILNIQRLKLDKLGEYSIDVAVDGRLEASLPFFVKQSSKTPHIPDTPDKPQES